MSWIVLYLVTVFLAAFLDVLNRYLTSKEQEQINGFTLLIYVLPVLNVLDAGVSAGTIVGRIMKK